jgi:hypothetical protein
VEKEVLRQDCKMGSEHIGYKLYEKDRVGVKVKAS